MRPTKESAWDYVMSQTKYIHKLGYQVDRTHAEICLAATLQKLSGYNLSIDAIHDLAYLMESCYHIGQESKK